MKDYRIVYIKGEPRVVEWPEEPKVQYGGRRYGRTHAWNQYKAACEAAIANGVPPADKEQVDNIIRKHVGLFGKVDLGHPYSLEGYEVRVEEKKVMIARGSGYKIESSSEIRPPDLIEDGKKYAVYKVAVITLK